MTQFLMLGVVLLALAAPAPAAEMPAGLVDAYLSAQMALADDSLKELPAAAKAIETSATPLGTAAQPVVDGARKLGGAKDLTAARTAFGELSDALVTYAEKSGTTLPAGLHVAYCPMADKPWVQKGTDIKNPYYGSQMLTCGVIKK